MNAFELRRACGTEETDYMALKSLLGHYANPRDKISRLLKMGHLIRVKKGLYVFGEAVAQKPYVKETLANKIYGPSAISLQYALFFYGLIPERVEEITCITNKRNKRFNTPAGVFSYRHLHPSSYAVGIVLRHFDESHNILIASKEKALADMLVLAAPKTGLESEDSLWEYLIENLRIERQAISSLKPSLIKQIAEYYRHPGVNHLERIVKRESRK